MRLRKYKSSCELCVQSYLNSNTFFIKSAPTHEHFWYYLKLKGVFRCSVKQLIGVCVWILWNDSLEYSISGCINTNAIGKNKYIISSYFSIFHPPFSEFSIVYTKQIIKNSFCSSFVQVKDRTTTRISSFMKPSHKTIYHFEQVEPSQPKLSLAKEEDLILTKIA